MPEFFLIYFFLLLSIPVLYYLHIPDIFILWFFVIVTILLFIPVIKSLFNAPFVPSNRKRVETMIKLANLNKNKNVCELGSGDGRVLRKAAKTGVKKAVGYEISLALIIYSKIVNYIQKSPVIIKWGDIWKQNYSDCDVVFAYLLPSTMKKVKKQIWPQLPKGARFVSNAFKIPDLKEEKKEDNVYLYIKE